MRFRVLVGCAALFVPGTAFGAPQANAGLTIGGAATDLRTNLGAEFHLGARADVMFFRRSERDMGFGPYVDVATAAFDTLELGTGASWLLPVTAEFPLVVSAGAFERHTTQFGWEPGVAGTLFFGGRSYNYNSWYGLALGGFLQARYGFGESRQTDIILGVQVDLAILAMPFILAVEAIRR